MILCYWFALFWFCLAGVCFLGGFGILPGDYLSSMGCYSREEACLVGSVLVLLGLVFFGIWIGVDLMGSF